MRKSKDSLPYLLAIITATWNAAMIELSYKSFVAERFCIKTMSAFINFIDDKNYANLIKTLYLLEQEYLFRESYLGKPVKQYRIFDQAWMFSKWECIDSDKELCKKIWRAWMDRSKANYTDLIFEGTWRTLMRNSVESAAIVYALTVIAPWKSGSVRKEKGVLIGDYKE